MIFLLIDFFLFTRAVPESKIFFSQLHPSVRATALCVDVEGGHAMAEELVVAPAKVDAVVEGGVAAEADGLQVMGIALVVAFGPCGLQGRKRWPARL